MRRFAAAALLTLAAPLLAQQSAGSPHTPAQGFMMQFDADKDGQVTLEEFKEPQIRALEQQFGYIDKDKSGGIDSTEMDTFAKEMQQRMQQMHKQGGAAQH